MATHEDGTGTWMRSYGAVTHRGCDRRRFPPADFPGGTVHGWDATGH